MTLYLTEGNLAFRGSNEVSGSLHFGNFLGMFEFLAKYSITPSGVTDGGQRGEPPPLAN